MWRHRVDELHPRARDHRLWGKCCWCDWELMELSVVDLINYLGLKGPHDLKHVPTASEEDALPLGDEHPDEEGGPKEEGDNPIETSLRRNPWSRRILRRNLRRTPKRTQVSGN